jgi:putative ATPase
MPSMDLFSHRRAADTAARAPLADRMRPRTLDEFVGQEHIIGPGRLLRRAIEADQLSSLIFYGPPGTGKTTLARIVAGTTQAHFIALNAVLSGVKDIRAAVEEANERRGMYAQRTILFVDEVHRFNKSQQDALLPWVENGTVIFIGATTENPYFEVNKALVSRSRIFQLRPLEAEHLRAVARAVIADPERGYGRLPVDLHADAIEHLVEVAGGDARGVLNALELAVETTPPDADGRIVVDLGVAEESIQRRAVLYDKEGDVHYDTASAFIKSVRGSDPDAALYWMARMLYAGEDPRFIFRRLIILAAEDIGLADPNAVQVVIACARAFDYVGLPEGRFHLTEAVLYLATAPKSNSAMAFFDALATVERERADDVPTALKDASRDQEGFGHGQGYLYPHAYRDHWVAQQYLPVELQGRMFYDPSDQGYERGVREAVHRRREAQLAAMLEDEATFSSEGLTFTGALASRDRDRWLARATGDAGVRLGQLRDRVLDGAAPGRHARVLDLRAGTGLLVWEAVRRAPEGGVWALADDVRTAESIEAAGRALDVLDRPVVLVATVSDAPDLLVLRGEGEVRFDAVIGRNALARSGVSDADLATVWRLTAPGGRLSLAETVPRRGTRPSSILGAHALPADLADRVRDAEAVAYGEGEARGDPRLAWNAGDLVAGLEAAGFGDVRAEVVEDEGVLLVTAALVARWFDDPGDYARHLTARLAVEEVARVRAAIAASIGAAPRAWRTGTVYVTGRRVG